MPWLTKSRFTAGLQCPKRLWNEVHAPLETGLPDSLAFMNGRAVDRLAQTFAAGTVVSREQGMPAAIAETTRLLRERSVRAGADMVVYQPAFRAGNLAVIADVLRINGSGATLIEVKASTSVKAEHIPDVAYQALVLRQCKLPVERVMLAHVDNSFVLKRAGDFAGLIPEQDVTHEVEEALPQIAESAAALQEVMASSTRPVVSIGDHCNIPYECPFTERCRRERGATPEYPLELLPRGGKTVQSLLASGYSDLVRIPAERLTRTDHRRIHAATISGEPYFDADATADLRKLTYPMAHLDFETIAQAVPEVLGTRPYQGIPFQWSIHVEESANSVRHAEFLAIGNFGDFDALAGALLAALPESGPVFAYNSSFERGKLEWLADRLPKRANALRDVVKRLVDLLPITRAAYYHRDMKGSYSIKAVLPTIDPALAYDNLAEVREGDAAQLAFLQLRDGTLSTERAAEIRSALLMYCERDSWGLVVLRRFLCGEALP
ncbi:MAG: DUF2779 domain-containing protein [Steroidobacteraceae bacterium]